MTLDPREYIAVPPDGAGKKLLVDHLCRVTYNNASSQTAFSVGDVVEGATSGAVGVVLEFRAASVNTGFIDIDFGGENLTLDFQAGEDLEVNNVKKAEVVSAQDLHVSRTQVVGGNNSQFVQQVDVLGSAHVRFPGGSPNFDAAGRTEIAKENWIGSYSLQYDERPDLIDTQITGPGTVTWDANSRTAELAVDDANGTLVHRQTHLYHHYRPGVAMSALMTVAAGASTANCVRRWGIFDENDGLFFEYDGTTLYVVERSSATGSVTEVRVPQSQWNGDKMNGTGDVATNPSRELLDPSQFWLYEIRFLYLGAGPARFAVFGQQGRVVVHTFRNGGNDVLPYMRTGSLPLHWEIFNTAATAGPTQMRQGNSTVQVSGDWAPQRKSYGSPKRDPVSVNTPTAIGVLRAKQNNPTSGQPNRGLVFPTNMTIWTATEPVHIALTKGGDFTIDTWFSDIPESLLEQGVNGVNPPPIVDPGRVTFSTLVSPGEITTIDLDKVFSVRSDGEIIRQSDITQWVNHAVIAESITGNPTDVTVSFNWDEVV